MVAGLLTSCLGGLNMKETHYFSIPNQDGDNKNYYRLKIRTKTLLSKAEYNSGWYPRESVDQLFGEVSSASDTEYMRTQRALKGLSNKYILETEENYLKEAAKPNPKNLQALFDARKRIQAYPAFRALDKPFGSGSISFEYNPALGKVVRHIDEKQVFFLSSNPDEIIREINTFTEANETAIKLQDIADAFTAQRKKNLGFEQTIAFFNEQYNTIVLTQIETLQITLGEGADKATILDGIKNLNTTLKNK